MMTTQSPGGSSETTLRVLAIIIFVLAFLHPAIGLSQTPVSGTLQVIAHASAIPSPRNPYWWVQVDYLKPGKGSTPSAPWADSDFTALSQWGINGVEINLMWGSIEPRRGEFDFALLDRYLAAAAQAHIQLFPIFWESVWGEAPPKVVGKNPPQWITARDLTSDGVAALEPPWWDKDSRQAYFDYVARTIEHLDGKPGFGGIFANYGWLDAMWGPRPKDSKGLTGYARADIQAFYQWLPQTYGTLAAFNQRWHTSFDDWKRIPAARPGEPLFAVYQGFRYQSVVQAYDELSRVVRARTKAPMLYYWGGHISGRIGPGALGNDPDLFFKAAQRYHAIVVLDDANETGINLLFGSMARSYHVPLLQEWTPLSKGLREESAQWLGHLGMGSPFEVGIDFFIYPPPDQPDYIYAWSQYRDWHATLAQIKGQTPEQPVAVLMPTMKIATGPDLEIFPDLNHQIRDFWRLHHVLPHFITDQQVEDGAVKLEQFKAIIDLGNERADLPALRAYAGKHPVLDNLEQMVPLLRPYVTLDPAFEFLEVMPVVDGTSVWLTLANCSGDKAYSGSISFDPQAVGLKSTAFDVKMVKSGELVPATRPADGKTQWRISLPPAGFAVVRLTPRQSTKK